VRRPGGTVREHGPPAGAPPAARAFAGARLCRAGGESGQEIRNGGRGAAVALRGEEEPGVL